MDRSMGGWRVRETRLQLGERLAVLPADLIGLRYSESQSDDSPDGRRDNLWDNWWDKQGEEHCQ
jgi:hypothetical protein